MEINYNETKEYWDKIFEEQNTYDPFNKLSYAKIENAIEWLCNSSKQILDFGCGTGRVLSRCFDYDVDSIYGIDLSEKAIKIARHVMDKNNLKDKSNFLCGDLKSLKKIKHTEFDGVILFNIIDNLKPEDGKLVIKEINRILNTNGRVILKLNPYISQQEIGKRNDMQEISNDFYKESSGLFLWNISDDLLKEIISPYFYISSYKEIVFKEFNMSNRLYYLKKI